MSEIIERLNETLVKIIEEKLDYISTLEDKVDKLTRKIDIAINNHNSVVPMINEMQSAIHRVDKTANRMEDFHRSVNQLKQLINKFKITYCPCKHYDTIKPEDLTEAQRKLMTMVSKAEEMYSGSS